MGDGGVTHLSLSGNADKCGLFLFISTPLKSVELINFTDKKTANLIVGEKES